MKNLEFDAAYREAKRAAFSQAIARLHQMSSAAVSTLGKIMIDVNAPASTRVRAADSIPDHTSKAIETEDLAARVSELERTLGASKRRPRGSIRRSAGGSSKSSGCKILCSRYGFWARVLVNMMYTQPKVLHSSL
jgi:hypothetical protein